MSTQADKQTLYWLNTKKYCGGVTVNDKGFITSEGTAPCYKWMSGKKFSKQISWMRFKGHLLNYKKIQEA